MSKFKTYLWYTIYSLPVLFWTMILISIAGSLLNVPNYSYSLVGALIFGGLTLVTFPVHAFQAAALYSTPESFTKLQKILLWLAFVTFALALAVFMLANAIGNGPM